MPVDHAILLRQGYADQAAVAGSAGAGSGVGPIERAVRGTDQPLARGVKKTVGPESISIATWLQRLR